VSATHVEELGEVFNVMYVYGGSRGKAPLILNLGTGWRWAVNFTPRPLHRRERTLLPIK